MSNLLDIWALLDSRTPGGCDHCVAYRTSYEVAGIQHTQTHHHPLCPWMRERNDYLTLGND